MLATLVTIIFAFSLLPPVISYVPPSIEPEIAVKIEGDWHHTLGPDYNYTACDDLPDDGWFVPFELTAPAVCTTFTAEVWFLGIEDLYAYEFWLAWDWCWLELQSWTVIDLGEGGLTAHSDIVDADDTTPDVEPLYVQIWTFLNPVEEGVTGDYVVAELTFHVTQDPSYDDAFYSLLYIAFVEASTSCGVPIDPLTVEHAVAKLNSTPPVITKELEKNKTWIVGEQISMDINIYNATKLKSFEFLLNMPTWLEVDLQKHPVEIGDFLPPPYEEFHIVVGPSMNFPFVCEDQIWVKVIRDCEKPPVSGDGTLATITFTVLNPFLPGKAGPDYTYCDPQHMWVPENVTDEICFKEAETPMGYWFYEDEVWIDGFYCWQYPTHYDPQQDRDCALLAPPFGPPCQTSFYWSRVTVPKVGIAFVPIPGDGNLDGHVGLLDMVLGTPFYGIVKIGASYYDRTDLTTPLDIAALAADMGLTVAEWEALFELVDIVEDDMIDLFDLVQMAKNWCRTEPPKDP